MARSTGAGDLFERVAFDRRITIDDGYGNKAGDWKEEFQCRARYVNLRGGEAVMASRLEGRHVQVIRVRASSQTRQVTTDWRVRDARSDAAFNIRDVSLDPTRAWIDVLAESGVASG